MKNANSYCNLSIWHSNYHSWCVALILVQNVVMHINCRLSWRQYRVWGWLRLPDTLPLKRVSTFILDASATTGTWPRPHNCCLIRLCNLSMLYPFEAFLPSPRATFKTNMFSYIQSVNKGLALQAPPCLSYLTLTSSMQQLSCPHRIWDAPKMQSSCYVIWKHLAQGPW